VSELERERRRRREEEREVGTEKRKTAD